LKSFLHFSKDILRIKLAELNVSDAVRGIDRRKVLIGAASMTVSFIGLEVIAAEVTKELNRQPLPDLVLLDVDMPRLDGLGVLEELRAQMRTASLPVIILTAHHDDTEEKALDLGASDYLTKPVQTRSLVARVRAVLKRASMC